MSTNSERLRVLAEMARARNGRLAVDWFTRAQIPRWKLILLNGQWYERERLRQRLERSRGAANRRLTVPATGRRLTNAEIEDASNTSPWRLYDPPRWRRQQRR